MRLGGGERDVVEWAVAIAIAIEYPSRPKFFPSFTYPASPDPTYQELPTRFATGIQMGAELVGPGRQRRTMKAPLLQRPKCLRRIRRDLRFRSEPVRVDGVRWRCFRSREPERRRKLMSWDCRECRLYLGQPETLPASEQLHCRSAAIFPIGQHNSEQNIAPRVEGGSLVATVSAKGSGRAWAGKM